MLSLVAPGTHVNSRQAQLITHGTCSLPATPTTLSAASPSLAQCVSRRGSSHHLQHPLSPPPLLLLPRSKCKSGRAVMLSFHKFEVSCNIGVINWNSCQFPVCPSCLLARPSHLLAHPSCLLAPIPLARLPDPNPSPQPTSTWSPWHLFTVDMKKQIAGQSIYLVFIILLFHFLGKQILGFNPNDSNSSHQSM